MIHALRRDPLRAHTPDAANARIDHHTEANLRRYARHEVNGISERIHALEQEWDAERALLTGGTAVSLVGTALAGLAGRRFLLIPGLVLPFLLQNSVQGWSWPAVWLRSRFGLRTRSEIDLERAALKAMRGDYGKIPGEATDPGERVRQALQAAGRVRW